MAAPWEKYAPTSSGPWEKYAAPSASPQQERLDAIKAKYGPLMNAPEDAGFLSGLGSTINPIAMVKGAAQAIMHPIDTAKGVVAAQGEQFSKAGTAAKEGRYSEAAGHALAGALPLVGPAAATAGEKIGEGRPGEGLGEAVGLAGTLAIPAGVRAVAGKAAPAAQALERSAKTQYARVLNPTTKGNKFLTQTQVAPGLIERGEMALTLKGLKNKASARVAQLGDAIDAEWQNLPAGAAVELDPLLTKIQGEASALHTLQSGSGKAIPKGPQAKQALSNIDALQETLMDVSEVSATTGKLEIPVERLRNLRQYFDNVAAKSGRYEGKALSDISQAEAHGMAADAIRGEFAKQFPSIAAINKEFSFWKNVEKVTGDTLMRREGQAIPLGRKIMQGAAQGALGATHGPGGFILGKFVGDILERLTTSPAWGTVSAVAKDRLADAIARGHKAKIELVVREMARSAGLSTQVGRQTERNPSEVAQ